MKNKIILSGVFCMAIFCSCFGQTLRSIESIGNSEVTVIELVANGDIWVGTNGNGAQQFKASTQSWHPFNRANYPAIKSDTINAIAIGTIAGKQSAFFGTPSGLSYSQDSLVFSIDSLLPGETNIKALVLTAADSLIAFTAGAGAVVFDSTQKRIDKSPVPCVHMSSAYRTQGDSCTFGLTAGSIDSGACYTFDYNHYVLLLSPNLASDSVTAVFRDQGCRARFIGTRHGFSVCPDGLNCQNYYASASPDSLSDNYITSITQDCKGNVWLGTRSSGVAVFNPQQHKFRRITTADGLTTDSITALAFLSDSCTAYVGTTDGKIALVDDSTFAVKKVLATAIQQAASSAVQMRVFPQPATGQVNFMFENELKNGQLCFTDMNGRVLGYYELKNTYKFTLDISGVANGLYIYKISNDTELLKTGKFEVFK